MEEEKKLSFNQSKPAKRREDFYKAYSIDHIPKLWKSLRLGIIALLNLKIWQKLMTTECYV